MKGLQTGTLDGLDSTKAIELTEETLLSMVGEFLEENYKSWLECRASLKKLSRDLRTSDFRAYYESIRSEDTILERTQQESLDTYLSVKGVPRQDYFKALSRVDSCKIEKFLVGKTLSIRMLQSFSEETSISKQLLTEYMKLKQSLIEQAKLSPGWHDFQMQKVLCRIVEDKCYDEFGIDDPTATNLGYLLGIEGGA